jgi:TatA/E family protein of Tat protein translocase
VGIENPVHLMFIAAVALVVLGPKRLPELTRAAGKSIREFREALAETGTDQGDTRSARIPESASDEGACHPASVGGVVDEPPPVAQLAETETEREPE